MRIEKYNYVVTGGAGFIGSHVIDELLKRDDINKIFVIDKLGMGSDMDNIADDERVKFVFEDIASDRAYEDLPGIDYILHLLSSFFRLLLSISFQRLFYLVFLFRFFVL